MDSLRAIVCLLKPQLTTCRNVMSNGGPRRLETLTPSGKYRSQLQIYTTGVSQNDPFPPRNPN